MLVAHWERLVLTKVEVFWVVMNELWLWGTSRLSAGLGNAIEGHKPATYYPTVRAFSQFATYCWHAGEVDQAVSWLAAWRPHLSPEMLNTSLDAFGLLSTFTKAVARSFTCPSCVTCEQQLAIVSLHCVTYVMKSESKPYCYRHLQSGIWHRNWPALCNPLEKPLLDWVVIQWPIDVNGPNGRPIHTRTVEQVLRVQLALRNIKKR